MLSTTTTPAVWQRPLTRKIYGSVLLRRNRAAGVKIGFEHIRLQVRSDLAPNSCRCFRVLLRSLSTRILNFAEKPRDALYCFNLCALFSKQ